MLRKQVTLFMAFLTVLLMFTGCGVKGTPLPGTMDEDTLLTAGREIVKLVAANDFQAVYDALREDQQALFSAVDIQKTVLDELDGAGVYREIEQSMVTGQSSQGEEYGVAVFYCAYSEDDVLIRTAFDQDMAFIGLSVDMQ